MWVKHLVVLFCLIFCSIYFFCYHNLKDSKDKIELKIFTMASHETKGFQSFIRSAKQFNLIVEVLGMSKKWQGLGQKILYYRKALFAYKNRNDIIVMVSDGYDVVFNANSSEILSRFHSFNTKVLISAEKNCWPDASLAAKYPSVKEGEKYLNSGLFMGYASYVYGILSHNMKIGVNDDDQLYFTKIFIDNELRKKYKIQLDSTSRIFQSLYAVGDEVYIDTTSGKAEVVNKVHSTHPCVIHGNGPSKNKVVQLGDVLANYWNLPNNTDTKGNNRKHAKN